MKKKPVIGLVAPKQTALDVFHELAQGAIGAIPFAGSPLASVFAVSVSKPLEKRRDDFFEALASQLVSLRTDVEEMKNFIDDDAFLAALPRGTAIALDTVSEEKRKLARNAIINSVLLKPSEDKRLIFFNHLQALSPIHFSVLSLFADPYAFELKNGKDYVKDLQPAYSTTVRLVDIFKGYDEQFLNIILSDLHDTGFTSQERNTITFNAGGAFSKNLTELGKEFLTFLEEPK